MNKKILVFALLLFLLPLTVKAECLEEEKTRISKLANNISTSVEYNEQTNDFSITFLNITGGFFIVDTTTNQPYYADYELILNNIQSGMHKYKIYDMSGCYINEVATKTVKVPYYNKYYKNEECKDFQDYAYCLKWQESEIPYKEWLAKVKTYKKEETKTKPEETQKETNNKKTDAASIIMSIYVDHYYIFLPIIIIAFTTIIYLKNKSDSIIYRKNKGEDITL